MNEMHDKGRTTDAPDPNLCREALPLLGERGRQSSDTSRVKKTASTQNPPVGDGPRAVPKTSRPAPHDKLTYPPQSPCHCETGSHTGRGNPRPLAANQGETDSHVAGAPRDGGISRFTKQPPSPFRGNDSRGSPSSADSISPHPLTPPRQVGTTPPLCKGRWVGASRAGGIVQQTPNQAPVSGESASNPAADNPSAASRQLPLHKGAESDTPASPALRAHFARLCAEADALHRADPGFDLDTALRDPAFVRLTAPDVGVPVADAWYALHRREYAETLRRESLEQAAAAVASGSLRPREGGRTSGGELLGTDPRHMTAAQRAELRDRIKRGERVYPR